jgi:tetracycline repressor-like protein
VPWRAGKNLDPNKLREFKLTFVTRLTKTGIIVEDAFRLSAGHGFGLLMRTFALTRGLWQSRSYEQQTAFKADPALAPICPNFDKELTRALTEYWRGASVTS